MRGIYRSTDRGQSWKAVPPPANTGNCWGSTVSPDGKFLFASYQVDGKPITESAVGPRHTKLFVTPTDKWDWQDISTGQPGYVDAVPGKDPLSWWRPEIDPRADAAEQRILIAPWGWRLGLWQVTVDWTGGKPTAQWKDVLNYDYFGREGEKPKFDSGWEHYLPRPLAYSFTPTSWGDLSIWTTGDQTLFSTDTTKPDWEDAWNPLYTQFIKEIDGERFYRTRGLQCTFVFDGDVYKNYNAQANGDNAIKESFDHGYSWHVGIMKPRSNSVAIVRDIDPPIVLAHISPGYGGSSAEGSLYAKRLTHWSPKDQWVEIAGGPKRIAGLPNRLYEQITPDPNHPGRVYIGTQGDGISKEIVGVDIPATLSELTDQVLALRDDLADVTVPIGPVDIREPATEPATIRVDYAVADGDKPFSGEFTEQQSGGHWLTFDPTEWTADHKTIRFTVRTGFGRPAVLMAHSATAVSVRLNGQAVPSGGTSIFPAYQGSAPSFHRPGPANHALLAGFAESDEILVTLTRPDSSEVVGLGEEATRQWLPWAVVSK